MVKEGPQERCGGHGYYHLHVGQTCYKNIRTTLLETTVRGIMTVSYTHLDVYKRQNQM